MVKKVVFAGGGIMILGLLCFGHEAFSYMRTSAGCLKDSVRNSVPVEFQIERARRMIKDLKPEVRRNMHVIAKEEAELERLGQRIAASEERSGSDREKLMRLKEYISSGKSVFMYAGRSYSIKQVKVDMSNRFERFKTAEATLDSLRKIHRARENSLNAARQKLEGMLAAKRQLLVEVENLEAQRQMVAAAQTTSNYHFDDSKLGRVKELISDLQIRLDTERKLVEAEDYFHDEIPMEESTPDDIVDQVTSYLEKDLPKAEALADSK